jgi:hypothetical protein
MVEHVSDGMKRNYYTAAEWERIHRPFPSAGERAEVIAFLLGAQMALRAVNVVAADAGVKIGVDTQDFVDLAKQLYPPYPP